MPQQIDLDKIELVQSRAKIDMETIEDYAYAMRMGTNFPAIRVVFDGDVYWCYDGCHRTLAARQAKQRTILASVHQGTRRDAVLRSCGVNAANGMRRTREDKRRAVRVLLEDPEWCLWNNSEIARHCKVSEHLVRDLRPIFDLGEDRTRRRVVRNGTEYEMNVDNIGQRKAPEPMPLVPEREHKPCRDCGQEFEDDGWAICKACRKKIFQPEPQVVEDGAPFTLGFPQRCPATDKIWHKAWTDGDCGQCAHYRKRKPWGHGCQHPQRLAEIGSDSDNEFETEAALIADEDDEPEPEAKTFKINVVGQLGVVPKRESQPETEPSKLAVHFSSETPEHYTPQVVIDAALACLGEIDVDPCSNSSEHPNVPAREHYTREDDGLLQLWYGRVYMNPPYGREIDLWVEKLCEEHDASRTTEAIALVPSRTDTQWWRRLRDFPVCFVTGRLTFVGNDDPAPFPSAIFYLGENIGAFYRAFHGLGDCWQRMEPGISFGE